MRGWFLLIAVFAVSNALDVKWTPAADGGPSRFSKKYRDAAGIDDSRWTGTDDSSAGTILPGLGWLLPQSREGWLLAAAATICLLVVQHGAAAKSLGRTELRPESVGCVQRV